MTTMINTKGIAMAGLVAAAIYADLSGMVPSGIMQSIQAPAVTQSAMAPAPAIPITNPPALEASITIKQMDLRKRPFGGDDAVSIVGELTNNTDKPLDVYINFVFRDAAGKVTRVSHQGSNNIPPHADYPFQYLTHGGYGWEKWSYIIDSVHPAIGAKE